MWSLIRELRANVDWWFKRRLTWSSVVRPTPAGELDTWARGLTDTQGEHLASLTARYELAPWSHGCSADELSRNMGFLDLLDQHLSDLDMPERALDVGCRAW